MCLSSDGSQIRPRCSRARSRPQAHSCTALFLHAAPEPCSPDSVRLTTMTSTLDYAMHADACVQSYMPVQAGSMQGGRTVASQRCLASCRARRVRAAAHARATLTAAAPHASSRHATVLRGAPKTSTSLHRRPRPLMRPRRTGCSRACRRRGSARPPRPPPQPPRRRTGTTQGRTGYTRCSARPARASAPRRSPTRRAAAAALPSSRARSELRSASDKRATPQAWSQVRCHNCQTRYAIYKVASGSCAAQHDLLSA